MLRIQLKVHEPQVRDKYRMITVNKTDTLKEVLAEIRKQANEDFCASELTDRDDKNIRFRSYDPKLKLK